MGTFKNFRALIIASGLFIGLYGCTEKDLSGETDGGQTIPETGYFDFATKQDYVLTVDYGLPGYRALIEVYTENPLQENVEGANRLKKEGLEPVFKAYTDKNCRFKGNIVLPTAAKSLYLYTDYIGLPQCVQLEMTENGTVFDLPAIYEEMQSSQLTVRSVSAGDILVTVDKNRRIYSLCEWEKYGKITFPKNYLTSVATVGDQKEEIGKLLSRLQSKIGKAGNKKDNSELLSNEELTNISISPVASDGVPVEKAAVDLVFLNERAGYRNTLGYYYYKSGTSPDVASLPKYILFPNVSIPGDDPYDSYSRYNSNYWGNAPLQTGNKVRLKFFGENYDQSGSDYFLPGYTIGWFLISNGFDGSKNVLTSNNIYYSNKSMNKGESRCITLFDKKTQKMIVGFEDGDPGNHDRSYEDVLFYVESDPLKAIVNPEKPGVPSIDEDDDIVIPDQSYKAKGTLAFEDLWPYQGDYDLNDVAVRYESTVTFDKNNCIVKVEDVFTPAHNGAGMPDAFGYRLDDINPDDIESIHIDYPAGAVKSSALNSVNREAGQDRPVVILYDNAQLACRLGGEYKVSISFKESARPEMSRMIPPYNPFIIPGYKAGEMPRIEVHLPKKTPTVFADMKLFGKGLDKSLPDRGLYYFSIDNLPFAIDIPSTDIQFEDKNEKVSIREVYPKFSNWVATEGKEDADWYK